MAKLLTWTQTKALKPGTHAVGGGLYAVVRDTGANSWLVRGMLDGKQCPVTLGQWDHMSLAEAREKAAECRKLLKQGTDPRKARADAKKAAEAAARTFKDAAEAFIESNKAGWKNAKHAAQWANTLATYADPHFGELPVSAVETAHVLAALQPIWTTKTETAGRVRGRVEAVLDYAKARGWRTGENPARWRGHMSVILPARDKVAPVQHHPALPWQEIGAFMSKLAAQKGTGAKALHFAILTAARSGEVRGALWSEVDLEAKVWTVPGHRMKAGREHRVPLSQPALAVLRELAAQRTSDSPDTLIFAGMKAGKPLSDMSLTAVLRRMKLGHLTAHGFRSSFRDWAGEETNYPREVAEAALAHRSGGKVEQAYARGDLFEKRRKLMDAWAEYCSRPAPEGSNVVAFRAVG